MRYEVQASVHLPGAYVAEAIGSDNEVYHVLFSGPDAERRAYAYAAWQHDLTIRPPHDPRLEAAAGFEAGQRLLSGERRL